LGVRRKTRWLSEPRRYRVGGLAGDFPKRGVAGVALDQLKVPEGPFKDDPHAVADAGFVVADQDASGAIPFEEGDRLRSLGLRSLLLLS